MRLIDANQLRKDIVERGAQLSGCYSAGIARYMDRMLAHVLAEVDIAPAVDAVPVVRCKDCEYYHQAFCEIWSKYGTIQTREQGFCYMAERKER